MHLSKYRIEIFRHNFFCKNYKTSYKHFRKLKYVNLVPTGLEKLRPSRRRCYVCENAASNDECNAQGMRECMPNQVGERAYKTMFGKHALLT